MAQRWRARHRGTLGGACFTLVLWGLSVFYSAPAHAWGPGLNLILAEQVVDELRARDSPWADALSASDAPDLVAFGAVFSTWMRDIRGINHSRQEGVQALRIAKFLLDKAEEEEVPLWRLERQLFSLGLLIGSRSEFGRPFLLSAIAASAPLGPLYASRQSPTSLEAAIRGHAPVLLRGWADLLIAGSDRFVDALYKGVLISERANDRAEAMAHWYCESLNEYYGINYLCDESVVLFRRWVDDARRRFGQGGLDASRQLAASWMSGGARGAFWAWLNSPLSLLTAQPPEEFFADAPELTQIFDSAWGDKQVWDELLEQLLPPLTALTIASLDGEPPLDGFDPAAVEAYAGQLSLMAALPDDYAPEVGFVVDRLRWRDDNAYFIDEISRGDALTRILLELRHWHILADSYDLKVKVYLDRPGWDSSADTLILEYDRRWEHPAELWAESLPNAAIIQIWLPGNLVDVESVYVELYIDDSDKPALTTNVDRFWSIRELPLTSLPLWMALRSYGRFPGSLPINDPLFIEPTGQLFVTARSLSQGPLLEDVEVLVAREGQAEILRQGVTGSAGTLAFDGLEPGRYNVFGRSLRPDFVAGEARQQIEIDSFSSAFAALELERVPTVTAPGPWQPGPRCVRYSWNMDELGGAVTAVEVSVVALQGAEVIEPQLLDPQLVQVCLPDSSASLPADRELQVELSPIYDTVDSFGLVATSPAFKVDPVTPEFSEVQIFSGDGGCVYDAEELWVEASVEVGPSGLKDVGWRSTRETGGLRPLDGVSLRQSDGHWRIQAVIPDSLREDSRPFRLVGASVAGLQGVSAQELIAPRFEPELCDYTGAPPDSDTRGDSEHDAAGDPLDASADASGGGAADDPTAQPSEPATSTTGCSAAPAPAGTSAPLAAWLLALALLVSRAPRIRRRAPR